MSLRAFTSSLLVALAPARDNAHVRSEIHSSGRVDCIGTPQGGQSGGKVVNATRVAANIKRLGALGLQVHVTELDVKCPDPCTDAALTAQAQVYADLLDACLANRGVCTSFETWGFTDAVTWLTGDRCKGAQNCHPLPFDEHYAPKPAVAAMLAVLKQYA